MSEILIEIINKVARCNSQESGALKILQSS